MGRNKQDLDVVGVWAQWRPQAVTKLGAVARHTTVDPGYILYIYIGMFFSHFSS